MTEATQRSASDGRAETRGARHRNGVLEHRTGLPTWPDQTKQANAVPVGGNHVVKLHAATSADATMLPRPRLHPDRPAIVAYASAAGQRKAQRTVGGAGCVKPTLETI